LKDKRALENAHNRRAGRIHQTVGQVQQATFYNQPDEIVWRWTTDGIYSMKSAYSIQCSVSFSRFDGKSIWKAHAEGKQKFFAWLLVQTSRQTCS